MSGKLPGVEVEPVIGHFHLVSVDDLLLEDSVPVPKAVAPSRVVETCKAVEEAGGKPTETAVSEGGIVLLLDDILNAEPEVGEAGCSATCQDAAAQSWAWSRLTRCHILLANVQHGIVESPAH